MQYQNDNVGSAGIEENDPMMDEGYYREYGGYKPHFKGTSPGYFPLEGIDIVYIAIFTFFTWIILIPPWYGMINAGLANSKQFATVCGIIFVGFYLVLVTFMYFVGRMKRRAEKLMVQKKLQQLQEQQRKQNEEKMEI